MSELERVTAELHRVRAQLDALLAEVSARESLASGADPRQASYDAVYDVIRNLPPHPQATAAQRNAVIWRAVHAALEAAPPETTPNVDEHVCRAGQNAEDCPPGAHTNLPYPFICPGSSTPGV